MITVTISINGNPIYARTAVNKGIAKEYRKLVNGKYSFMHQYHVDDGRKLVHHRADGAVELAIEMLKGIKEE